MKKIICFALGLGISVSMFAQTWTLDKAHSQLGFVVTHLSISDIEGSFKSVTSTITSSKEDWSDAVVELSAEASSISTNNDQRDGHLKSPDFFDAAQFPTLTFKSTSFKKASGKTYTVTGDLTLHGVTKPITLTAVFNGTTTNPMSKKTIAGFKVSGSFKRSDFNLGSSMPDAMISDKVTLNANAEFIKG